MKLLQTLGVLSPVYIIFSTLFAGGKKMGADPYGNRYFEGQARGGYTRPRRWVIYKNEPEASLVPPEYHGWLHQQTDNFPAPETASFRRPWQKPHRPNLTGTTAAYRPPGHLLQGGKRAPATGDYEPWTPNE